LGVCYTPTMSTSEIGKEPLREGQGREHALGEMVVEGVSILPRLVLWGVLAGILVASVFTLPGRWESFVNSFQVLGQWGAPEEQHRLQAVDLPHPHELLRQVDAVVPRDATVLLVTLGKDVGRYEYITFHRALYLLAPRAVWWVSPVASDGSWKSRWWVSRPLTAAAVGAVAREKGVQYVLAVGLHAELELGRKVGQWQDGYLLALDDGVEEVGTGGYAQYAGVWWPLEVLAAVAVLMGVGWGVLGGAARLGFRPGLLEGVALAWALGAGVTTVALLWLNWLGLSLGWQIVVITLLVAGLGASSVIGRIRRGRVGGTAALAAVETVARGGTTPEEARARIGHWLLRLLLLMFLGVQLLLVGVEAVGRPLRVWDSWANWVVKARIVFLDGYISPSVYADASRAVTQLDYPLMVPLAEAWLFGWLGAPDDRLVGVVHILFLAALVALCYCAVRWVGGGKTVALGVAVAVASISNVSGLAGIVFAEMPLIVFAAITAIYLYRWMQGGPVGTLLVACVSAGLMPWTKREGAVLLVCVCAGVLLANLTARRAWVAVGALVAGAVVLAGPWWLFVAQQGIANPAFGPITLETLRANIGRRETIWEIGWASLTGPGLGYVWPLVAVAGPVLWVLGRKRRGLRAAAFLPLSALLFSFVMGFSFVFSDFVPYEEHVRSSIDRLLAEVVVLPLLWLVFVVYSTGSRQPIDSANSGLLYSEQ
jgi:hypothetical protein